MRHYAFLLCLLVGNFAAASAQAPPAPTTPMPQTAPPAAQRSTDCAPMKSAPPRGSTAPEGTVGQSNEALGDKLARSNGVLCPPADVDPEMRAPAPDAGSTPVIPPPGSLGGNPGVQPK